MIQPQHPQRRPLQRSHSDPSSTSELPKLLNFDGAAEVLGTSVRHIRRLWEERRIPGIRVGGVIRFDPRDLAAFIAANRVEAVR